VWENIIEVARILDSQARFFQKISSPSIERFFTLLIEPKIHSLILIACLLYTKFKNEKIRKAAFGSLWLYPFLYGIKCFVGRSRPYLNEDVFSLHFLSFKETHSSFPSSHAAALGLFLSVFRPRYWPFMLPIAFVRVLENVHYPTDVLVGLILGFFIPKISNPILRFFEARAPLKWLLKA
jgi:undecaprenyl-diphosphatase